jgi:hypothetical protein
VAAHLSIVLCYCDAKMQVCWCVPLSAGWRLPHQAVRAAAEVQVTAITSQYLLRSFAELLIGGMQLMTVLMTCY